MANSFTKTKPPKWRPTNQSAPARVAIGSVSKPRALPAWRPVNEAAPKRVGVVG